MENTKKLYFSICAAWIVVLLIGGYIINDNLMPKKKAVNHNNEIAIPAE